MVPSDLRSQMQVLMLQDSRRRLFSKETIDSLPTLLDSVRGRDFVEGLEATGGGPRTVADFLREKIPDGLEARVFILEHWQWLSLIVVAFGIFTLVSVIIMFRIDPLITLVVTLPLLVIILVANAAEKAVHKYREASRKSAGKVTGFIGELFGAAQAIQVGTGR